MEAVSEPNPQEDDGGDGGDGSGRGVGGGGVGFTPQQRKRYRKERRHAAREAEAERRRRKGEAQDGSDPVLEGFEDFARLPTSLHVLTDSLKRQLTELTASSSVAGGPADGAATSAVVVPDFKVGSLEIYKRFPHAYEALMDRHDCGAVKRYLLDTVMARIAQTSSPGQPTVRVADFGCGTGRIEAMVAGHAAVKGIFAYDGEVAMLNRCLINTVKAAMLSGARSGVRILATAEEAQSTSEEPFFLPLPSRASAENVLDIVVRPCTYQSLQAGFLSKTNHRKCHLAICAWSLSYLMRLQWGQTHWHAAVDAVVQELVALLDTRASDAAVVVIETLGTGTATPTRSSTLVQRLEETHGFTVQWVRTDYTFAGRDEARRMTRFFFGDRVAQLVETEAPASEAADVVLPECTGIWTLWKAKEGTQ